MNVLWTAAAWEDFTSHWCHPQNKQALKRLLRLIEECGRTPFKGTGKPEPLRHELAGFWSRRITDTHRLVYRVEGDRLEIVQCLHHYGD